MLKYSKTDIVFQEIPDETSLAIAISGCRIHCKGCHSRDLWEDKGEILDVETLCGLLNKNKGITCLLLMGGEHDINALTELFMYAYKRVKTAWYCGLDLVPKDKLGIVQYLNYLKLGHFDIELGGLDSPTTNQRFYEIEHQGDGNFWRHDMTFMFQKQNKTENQN